MEELDRLVYTNRGVFNHWRKFVLQDDSPIKPLHIAAMSGIPCWVKQLLNHGEKPDEISHGFNALQASAFWSWRSMEILRLLLEKCEPGCDINTETESELSPFHLWIRLDPTIDNIRGLLELGGDPTRVGKYKFNAFHHFSTIGSDPEAFELLFQRAGNEASKCLNLAGMDEMTPLHVLLCYRNQIPPNLLQAFVDKGANVNVDMDHSFRPLQFASSYGMVDTLRILLPKVTEIDDPDYAGDTALHEAAVGGHKESIRFLLENNAKINGKNHRDWTPLHHAAAGSFPECVELLLDWPGIDANTCDKNKRTPLFLACSSNSPETACLILDRLISSHLSVAEINQPSSRGRTPLSQSCASGLDMIVTKLVQYAKDHDEVNSLQVNGIDAKRGLTPLHHAASQGSVACMSELLAINANVAIKDKKGRTPLRVAYEYWTRRNTDSGYEDTISILIDKDREGAVSDNDLVAICAAHGSVRLLQQLHGLNANLSRTDRYGWTPLDLARKTGHSNAERFLRRQAAWAGLLPSRWVSNNTKLAISGNGLQISYDEDGMWEMFSISADKPVPAGLDVYYFEVTIKKLGRQPKSATNPLMAIGFCTLDGAAIKFPGLSMQNAPTAVSWGYHSDDGSLRYSANINTEAQKNASWRYSTGDTIGCGVDYTKREIWFTRNSTKIEYVFTGIQGRLFPVLGLGDIVELDTKFAGNFVYENEETKGETGNQ
ncbi:ankyrin repeat-containing domain protein [Xylaria telfairii]|nr:ankyrin repeat-containing domain protein [Xylaria telfairii]